MIQKRFPISPFTESTAREKVQNAEDAWNTKNPILVSESYTLNRDWRNRNIFIHGRDEVIQFLTQKWWKVLEYKFKKSYGVLQKIKLR